MTNRDKKHSFIDILLYVVIAVLVVLLCLKLFVVTEIEVDGLSMYPTLDDAELLWGSRLSAVDRGDIVVFGYDDTVLIKRAVALQGDKVWVGNSGETWQIFVLTVDGDVLSEQYTWRGDDVVLSATNDMGFLEQYTSQSNSYTVPDNSMLALGDNRQVSRDCRHIGVVSLDSVIAVVFSYNLFG